MRYQKSSKMAVSCLQTIIRGNGQNKVFDLPKMGGGRWSEHHMMLVAIVIEFGMWPKEEGVYSTS